MKRILLVICILAAFMVVGCKSTGTKRDTSAAKPAVAKKVKKSSGDKTVYLLFDKGITKAQPANKAKAQNQIGDYMKRDLAKRLKKHTKANVVAIDNVSGFKKGKGSYLLSVKVVKYNPGSSAARYFVGFGAGAASMDIKYTLKNGSNKVLVQKSDGVGTGGSWKRIAVKLNDNMVKVLKPKI